MKKLMLALYLTVAGCSLGAKGGMPDYCYVKTWSEQNIPRQYWYLMGHRKWDADIQIGIFETIDEAISTSKKLDCQFRY